MNDLSPPVTSGLRIFIFGFSWNPEQALDSYFSELVASFRKIARQVFVLQVNDYLLFDSVLGTQPWVDVPGIVNFIEQNEIDLVICLNNAGNWHALRHHIKCPILVICSDGFLHLFQPDYGSAFQVFDEKSIVVVPSTDCIQDYQRRNGPSKAVFKFLPFATTLRHIESTQDPLCQSSPYAHSISFIGSALDISPTINLLKALSSREGSREVFQKVTKLLKKENNFTEEEIKEVFECEITQKYFLTPNALNRELSNVKSLHDRFNVLCSLSEFNPSLFGTSSWLDSLCFTNEISLQLQVGQWITSHDDLSRVYNESKLSITLPQAHVPNALQYRVCDIMASRALLVGPFSKDSDLYRVFGSNVPVPSYSNIPELKDLVRYFLNHENERLDLVRKCNELIAKGFSFEERVQDYLKLVGIELKESLAELGELTFLLPQEFTLPPAEEPPPSVEEEMLPELPPVPGKIGKTAVILLELFKKRTDGKSKIQIVKNTLKFLYDQLSQIE